MAGLFSNEENFKHLIIDIGFYDNDNLKNDPVKMIKLYDDLIKVLNKHMDAGNIDDVQVNIVRLQEGYLIDENNKECLQILKIDKE